jgi:hypothetical protein
VDLNSPVVQLCIAGTQAEYAGNREDAIRLYGQAWEAARDDYEACIAAHYVARFQANPEETLRWNREALDRAGAVEFERVKDFYPSLYLNMGHSYELLGDQAEARRYYDLAAGLGAVHSAHNDRIDHSDPTQDAKQ